jgi:hypothetical protein
MLETDSDGHFKPFVGVLGDPSFLLLQAKLSS